VLLGVGDADTGDRHSGCGGQIGQPVRTRASQFARVGKQYPDIAISLVSAITSFAQGCQHRITDLLGVRSVRTAEMTC
jgi:hypothetical protein